MFVGRERRLQAPLSRSSLTGVGEGLCPLMAPLSRFWAERAIIDRLKAVFRRLVLAERPPVVLLSEVAPPFAAFACQLTYHPA